jgi:hypothetical protein
VRAAMQEVRGGMQGRPEVAKPAVACGQPS